MDLPIMTVEEFIAYKAAQREQTDLAEAYYRVNESLERKKLIAEERFCDAMEELDRMVTPRYRRRR